MKNKGYDIIGDIHGHSEELKALLETMGYLNQDGCYRHPNRQAIFLGDFIDRGPDQIGVLSVVMAMCEQGAARSVMGNHEFNALAFHTQNPNQQGTWLRPRTNKNIHQHLQFLDEYLNADDKGELDRVLNFFWSLPLWLELDGLRVVHACWEQRHIDALGNDNRLSMRRLVEASTKGTTAYNAIESLLKGVEIELPEGVSAEVEGTTIKVKGPKGEVKKTFIHPRVSILINAGKIILDSKKATKKEKVVLGTFTAHLKNMVKGVQEHFVYKLKICSGHFPMNVSLSGNNLVIKNFHF